MSKLVESYALSCGVPIGKPRVADLFFPLDHPIDKVILLHAFGGAIQDNRATFPAKIYDHFSEVVSILKPIAETAGYKIYQIGSAGEPAINGVEYLCGKTTYHQCVYLVKNCALLIGNDSTWIHHRGWFGGSLVGVYGPTDVKNHGPYWNDPNKTILIESHRKGKKPTYASNEHPKTINYILPEQIAHSAMSLLGLAKITHHSYWIGPNFHNPVIELVPNVVMAPNVNINGALILRMDYHFDEKNMAQNIMIRKCAIITDREIDINILSQLKNNIVSIRVEIDKVSPEWIKKLRRIGIQVGWFAAETDPKKLVDMRLKYAEACLFDQFLPPTREEFVKASLDYLNKPLDTALNLDNLMFKTNKFLLSEGKIHLSKAHWKAGKIAKSTDDNVDAIIDSDDFWLDQQHFYFFKSTS